MQSIHISATALQRIGRLIGKGVLYALPSSAVVMASLTGWVRWYQDIATRTYVSKQKADLVVDIKRIASDGLAHETRLREHEAALNRAWAEIVVLHAELEVYRRYGNKDPQRRGELIEDATRFYRAAYNRQLKETPKNPAEAAAAALLEKWRP